MNLFTVPFPTTEEMVKMGLGGSFCWDADFKFPEGYKNEVKEAFPSVERLHEALNREDRAQVGGLLEAYLRKVSRFEPKELVEAAQANNLNELVDRATQAVAFKEFLSDLEKRYFPERIAERERRRQEVLDSWKY